MSIEKSTEQDQKDEKTNKESKEKKGKGKRGEWIKFLKPEEIKEISLLSPDSKEYQRIRSRCYIRSYYSDPSNRDSQYKRNKTYRDKKKDTEEPKSTEKKKIDPEIRRKINLERAKIWYSLRRNDPTFKEVSRARSSEFRTKNSEYFRSKRELKKKGIMPVSTKFQERKNFIVSIIPHYKSAREFRQARPKDYIWIVSNCLTEQMLSFYPDYTRRKKNKMEKDDKGSEMLNLIRKIRRNAAKCYNLDEFTKRFNSSYLSAEKMGIIEEIQTLFKKKEQ